MPLLSDAGVLRLIRANPEAYEVIDELAIAESPTWAHLAIAGMTTVRCGWIIPTWVDPHRSCKFNWSFATRLSHTQFLYDNFGRVLLDTAGNPLFIEAGDDGTVSEFYITFDLPEFISEPADKRA